MKIRTKKGKSCVFFREDPKLRSILKGRCILLDLTAKKPTKNKYCSRIKVCRGRKDYHTSEKELTEKDKKWFYECYEKKKIFLNERKKLLEKEYDTINDEELDEIELKIFEIEDSLNQIPIIVRKYFEAIKGKM